MQSWNQGKGLDTDGDDTDTAEEKKRGRWIQLVLSELMIQADLSVGFISALIKYKLAFNNTVLYHPLHVVVVLLLLLSHCPSHNLI